MSDVDTSSIQSGLAYREPWDEALDWEFKDNWGINTINFDDRLAGQFFFNHSDRIRISDLLFIYGEPKYIRSKTSGEHNFPVYITVHQLPDASPAYPGFTREIARQILGRNKLCFYENNFGEDIVS